jgi:hypothetical protein
MFVCLFIAAWAIFSYPVAVTITGDGAANLDLCLALMAFSSEGSFSCHTYCDTGPRFIRSHLKDRHSRPTVGFEQGTQRSPVYCASALTTAPHRRWRAAKLSPLLGAQGLWAGRIFIVSQGLSFSRLIWRTVQFSRLLRRTRGCGGPILTWILMGWQNM